MQINYSPLSQAVTREDIKAYTHAYPGLGDGGRIALWGLGGFIIGWFVVNMILRIGRWPEFFGFMIVSAIAVAIVLAFHFSARSTNRRRARLYKFATANNAQLTVGKANPGYVGMIFSQGHTRIVKEALVFSDGREVGSYMYTTGHGKSRTDHSWGYVRIKLTRRLPHMVLDAKSNNLLKRFSNLPDNLKGAQVLKLEGDFNDHFTLYVPTGYERDALYVFTPDVMAAVIDAGSNFDIEVIDDTLLLYAPLGLQIDDPKRLEAVMKLIDKISGEVEDQSDYYADERVGDRTLNLVARPGARLRRGVRVSAIAGAVFVAIYFILQVVAGIARY